MEIKFIQIRRPETSNQQNYIGDFFYTKAYI